MADDLVTIDQLYDNCTILDDAKDKISEHEAEYRIILRGVNGGPKEKKLTSQLIARFFKHFPSLAEQALNAHFDLCEDEDVEIRKHAIKELPRLCKDSPSFLIRISDVLTQLLQTDESSELLLVQSSLLSLFSMNIRDALAGLYTQILNGEDVIRDRAIKFLCKKVKTLNEDLFTKDVEEFMFNETKKVLDDVTGDEFLFFMKLLQSLKICGTVQGRQQLVNLITDQADIDKEFESSDPENVYRLVQCAQQALPLFSKNVPSTKFASYIIDHVIPVLSTLKSEDENVDLQLEVMRLLADLTTHSTDLEDVESKTEIVYDRLIEHMPLPPSEEKTDESEKDAPNFEFSQVEALLYTFHLLGAKYPDFLVAEKNSDRFKDFKLRLQYFARASLSYYKQLRSTLDVKALKDEEKQIKLTALKVTNNINVLIKDLLHNPPSYKANVRLSWRPVEKPAPVTSPGGKRSSSLDESKNPKAAKGDRQIYAPPSGKFSDKAGNFQGFRGRGRGRGYNRGGGYRGGYYGGRDRFY